jgi:hypothetical protein
MTFPTIASPNRDRSTMASTGAATSNGRISVSYLDHRVVVPIKNVEWTIQQMIEASLTRLITLLPVQQRTHFQDQCKLSHTYAVLPLMGNSRFLPDDRCHEVLLQHDHIELKHELIQRDDTMVSDNKSNNDGDNTHEPAGSLSSNNSNHKRKAVESSPPLPPSSSTTTSTTAITTPPSISSAQSQSLHDRGDTPITADSIMIEEKTSFKRPRHELINSNSNSNSNTSNNNSSTTGEFRIFCKLHNDELIPFQVLPSTIIQSIKTDFACAQGISPTDSLQLIYQGQRLRDDQSIEHYDIKSESILTVVSPSGLSSSSSSSG